MTNWQRKLDLKEEWKEAENGIINPQKMGKIIAAKLRILPRFDNPWVFLDIRKEEIIADFEAMSEEDSWEDFDDILTDLYNWGDISIENEDDLVPFPLRKKCCWVEIF